MCLSGAPKSEQFDLELIGIFVGMFQLYIKKVPTKAEKALLVEMVIGLATS